MYAKNVIHVLSRMVILDEGHILFCQTQGLNADFYFLPGGHIEPGESAKDAAQRELFEESNAICHVKRFLGCFEYSFEPDNERVCHTHEYNFVFEGKSETLKFQNAIVQPEAHIKLGWIKLDEINAIDLRPAPLKVLISTWLNAPDNQLFQSEMV